MSVINFSEEVVVDLPKQSYLHCFFPLLVSCLLIMLSCNSIVILIVYRIHFD